MKSVYATEGYCIGCWIRPIICSLGAVLPDVNTREVVTKYAVCDCGNDLGRLHPLTTDYSKHFGYDQRRFSTWSSSRYLQAQRDLVENSTPTRERP